MRASDKRIQRDNEFSDSEDEGEEGGRKNVESFKKKRKGGSDTKIMGKLTNFMLHHKYI